MEARHADQLRAARHAATEAEHEAEVERARAATFQLDLSARPTVRQLSDARATIEHLRAALPPSRGIGPDEMRRTYPGARDPPIADSYDAIRRDREVHELGLDSLGSMPHPTMLRLVQECCRQLGLREAALLPAALHRMCKALGALPPMEAFIRDVCAIAASDASSREESSYEAVAEGVPDESPASRSSTKPVLKVLRRWSGEIRQLRQLEDLTALLSDALAKRSVPGDAAPTSRRAVRGGSTALPPSH